MWTDLLPKLKEKFLELREAHRADIEDQGSQASRLLEKYDELSYDIVDGIGNLLKDMITNQAYIRKVYPAQDTEMYIEANQGLIENLMDCISESIETIPEFFYSLNKLVNNLKGYCILLRQDMRRVSNQNTTLRTTRKFRLIMLQINQTLDAIALLEKKAGQLASNIGKKQKEETEKMLTETGSNENELLEVLFSGNFSDEEQEMLLKILREKPAE